jgi:hypothetical protein
MDVIPILDAVLDGLALVASSNPNERLPKEEQIRCCIYAAIRPLFGVVCVERGYRSIDKKSRTECDLWASSPGRVPVWLEVKRCWSATGWVNKPPEQLASWETDLDKLRRVPVASDRYFVLVGFFDFDPLDEAESPQRGVIQNVRRFRSKRLLHHTSRKFNWRAGDGISWVGFGIGRPVCVLRAGPNEPVEPAK